MSVAPKNVRRMNPAEASGGNRARDERGCGENEYRDQRRESIHGFDAKKKLFQKARHGYRGDESDNDADARLTQSATDHETVQIAVGCSDRFADSHFAFAASDLKAHHGEDSRCRQ